MKTQVLTFEEMVRAMLLCEQTSGQTVYQHGQSVDTHIRQLLDYMGGMPLDGPWRLPKWIDQYKDEIMENLHPVDVISTYALYHDCGKPFCRIVDEEGRVHFPNHAETSKEVWLKVGGSETVANLIGWDMVIHTAKAEEIKRHLEEEWTVQDAMTLLVAALAEVHSNAKMFGGIESVSFKSKWKQIDRRGKQILKHFFKENNDGKN